MRTVNLISNHALHEHSRKVPASAVGKQETFSFVDNAHALLHIKNSLFSLIRKLIVQIYQRIRQYAFLMQFISTILLL